MNNSEPAFPGQYDHGNGQIESWIGITVLAYIATEFMAAMLGATKHESNDGNVFVHSDEYRAARAKEACAFADALLEELNKHA